MSQEKRYTDITNSPVSPIRLFGEMRYNGCNYIYDKANDVAIREDVLSAKQKECLRDSFCRTSAGD